MNTQLDQVITNAATLERFRFGRPDHDIPCVVHCPDDGGPEIAFLCAPHKVAEIYGTDHWTRVLNRRQTAFDYVKLMPCGVRLIVREAEPLTVAYEEGTIHLPQYSARVEPWALAVPKLQPVNALHTR